MKWERMCAGEQDAGDGARRWREDVFVSVVCAERERMTSVSHCPRRTLVLTSICRRLRFWASTAPEPNVPLQKLEPSPSILDKISLQGSPSRHSAFVCRWVIRSVALGRSLTGAPTFRPGNSHAFVMNSCPTRRVCMGWPMSLSGLSMKREFRSARILKVRRGRRYDSLTRCSYVKWCEGLLSLPYDHPPSHRLHGVSESSRRPTA